ncbi:MAG: prolipoprotein diacylglyceryl transferase [Flavobacteriales bacterium]|nr:prolipoprotein diacylglyceryl transferase [Flavobacteriales bacterium]
MYPTIYDLVLDIFGLSIPFLKLIQSFGFMVAMAFVAASITLSWELKRKEKDGLLVPFTEKIWTGKSSTVADKAVSALIGFLLGYKLLGLILDFDTISNNPQKFILSSEGSVLGGILGAALSVASRIYEDRKYGLPEPKEVEKSTHPYEQVGTITIIAAVMGILGAKLFHNLENLDDLLRDPVGSILSFSGLSFYGGLICAAATIIWYAKKKNIKVLHLMDSTAPGLILAYGIGRIGCQVAGDGDWGMPNDLPMPQWLSFMPEWVWAYDYPNNVLGVDLKEDFARMGLHSETGKAWPTPLYETTMAFIIFGILWSIRKKLKYPGMMFSIYLVFNGIERFAIEKVRINNQLFGAGITQAEIISTVLIIIGITGIVLMPKVGNRWAKW